LRIVSLLSFPCRFLLLGEKWVYEVRIFFFKGNRYKNTIKFYWHDLHFNKIYSSNPPLIKKKKIKRYHNQNNNKKYFDSEVSLRCSGWIFSTTCLISCLILLKTYCVITVKKKTKNHNQNYNKKYFDSEVSLPTFWLKFLDHVPNFLPVIAQKPIVSLSWLDNSTKYGSPILNIWFY
jgi:hypothetical protein